MGAMELVRRKGCKIDKRWYCDIESTNCLHGVDVQHLGHDGRLTRHPPAEGARVADDGLRYDLAQPDRFDSP